MSSFGWRRGHIARFARSRSAWRWWPSHPSEMATSTRWWPARLNLVELLVLCFSQNRAKLSLGLLVRRSHAGKVLLQDGLDNCAVLVENPLRLFALLRGQFELGEKRREIPMMRTPGTSGWAQPREHASSRDGTSEKDAKDDQTRPEVQTPGFAVTGHRAPPGPRSDPPRPALCRS